MTTSPTATPTRAPAPADRTKASVRRPHLLVVRPARPADRPALHAMVERTSEAALWRRFHGAGRRVVERELDRVAAPTDAHRSWLAITADAEVHGIATLATGRDGVTEAAFLVEDGWQRQGVGRLLFRAMAVEAARDGFESVLGRVQADNERAIRFFRSLGVDARAAYVGDGEVEVVVPVAAAGDERQPDERQPDAGRPDVRPSARADGRGRVGRGRAA